jgi:hypothetical protein
MTAMILYSHCGHIFLPSFLPPSLCLPFTLIIAAVETWDKFNPDIRRECSNPSHSSREKEREREREKEIEIKRERESGQGEKE